MYYGFAGSSLLLGNFPSCGLMGFSLRWLLSLQSTFSRHMGFHSWGCCAPELGRSSVVHGLKLPVACGILLDQGSKWCPLSTVQAGPS